MYIFLVASEENRTFYRMEIARIETERRNTYVCVCVCVCFSRTRFFFKRIGFLLVFLLRVLGEGEYEIEWSMLLDGYLKRNS